MIPFVLRSSLRDNGTRPLGHATLGPPTRGPALNVNTSRPPRRYLTLLAVATMLLAGCNGSDDDADATATSATTGNAAAGDTTTTSAENPDAAVLAAYRAYWDVVNTYGSEDKPFDPNEFKARFAPVASGAQYDSLFERFQLNRAEGLVYRGGEDDQLRPRVIELSDDRAVVEDCADDTGGIFSVRENAFTVDTTPGQHSLIRAVLRSDQQGGWTVTTQDGGDERCTP